MNSGLYRINIAKQFGLIFRILTLTILGWRPTSHISTSLPGRISKGE